jgi:hypothetical protein
VTSVSQSLKDDTYKLNIKRDIHVIPNFIELEKTDKIILLMFSNGKKRESLYTILVTLGKYSRYYCHIF